VHNILYVVNQSLYNAISVFLLFNSKSICNVCIPDFFRDNCSEHAEDECIEFRAEVPFSEQFNSTAFDDYCG